MSGTVEGAKRRFYSARKTAVMMEKARATVQAMKDAERADQLRRVSDPLERAKVALQRAGVAVFSHSHHVPGSTLFVVGTRTMEPESLIAHAQRFGRW